MPNGHTAAEDIRRAINFMNQVQIERQSFQCPIERIYFHQQANFSIPYFKTFEEDKSYRENLIEQQIRRRIEIFVEPFKSPRQIGNMMCVFLTQKEVTDIEQKQDFSNTFYYRLTLYILHIPLELYENSEARQSLINAAIQALDQSDYTITTFVTYIERVGPQERNRILRSQQSDSWNEVPIVAAKEGHIYL